MPQRRGCPHTLTCLVMVAPQYTCAHFCSRCRLFPDALDLNYYSTPRAKVGPDCDLLSESLEPAPPHSIADYRPTTRPGARAPHAWLPDGRSTLDLFGRGFVLLRLGDGAPDCTALEAAFARRGVPLTIAAIADPRICELYERRFVLVRPDGHVAWRSDIMPDDPLAVADCVRGASAL